MPEPELPPKTIGEPEHSENAKTKSPEYEGHAHDEMINISTPIESNNQKPTYHCEITCKTGQNWWDKGKPFAEIAGIILLAIYTGYTIKMYCANKKAADAAEKAAKAASAQVALAQESLDATVNQFRLDQRAWVSVKDVKLDKSYSLTENGSIVIDIHNTGKTPALDVGVAEVGFGQKENPRLDRVKSVERMTESPGSENDALFADFPAADPSSKIYIRFVIEYWDVFQKRGDPPHITSFCGYYPTKRPPYFFNSNGCSTMN